MEVGFYGKLPSEEDLLHRRVPDGFISVWDGWLRESLAVSRQVLGERWLDVYLASPIWRFACAPGACGAEPVAGLLAPSVDRIGGNFPLTVMWHIPRELHPLAVPSRCADWFDGTQKLIIDTLNRDQADPTSYEAFDQAIAQSARTLEQISLDGILNLDPADAQLVGRVGSQRWCVPLGSGQPVASAIDQLLYHHLAASMDPLVMWWTEGSAMVERSCLLLRGLPDPEVFTALLDGSWTQSGWRKAGTRFVNAASGETAARPRFLSAGFTDTGMVRSSNQDALLERSDVGLWVVADGMGGYIKGDEASRMVCDVLADIVPAATLEATLELIADRLDRVNRVLREAALRPVNPEQSGSTVVLLVANRDQCAVMWAGDSRLYRLRNGELEQLTTDHSWAMEPDGGADALDLPADPEYVITRAVGGDDLLKLDVVQDRLQPGDRFLLCSDGLTRELTSEQIAQLMTGAGVEQCARSLVEATLSMGARDNVTAVVVEAL